MKIKNKVDVLTTFITIFSIALTLFTFFVSNNLQKSTSTTSEDLSNIQENYNDQIDLIIKKVQNEPDKDLALSKYTKKYTENMNRLTILDFKNSLGNYVQNVSKLNSLVISSIILVLVIIMLSITKLLSFEKTTIILSICTSIVIPIYTTCHSTYEQSYEYVHSLDSFSTSVINNVNKKLVLNINEPKDVTLNGENHIAHKNKNAKKIYKNIKKQTENIIMDNKSNIDKLSFNLQISSYLNLILLFSVIIPFSKNILGLRKKQ
ncbi:hypothetical protein [Apilactobacillus xinyiensis]|uniref:hypothetical protein n=1 Tax=Apilactobacillus xinyiensis TaxID=2841032 RepID=UPI00200EC866|nr:hypothetical protein [Apilactobacillus xinyiensis]MCL0330677.1 hypothetical protein [Apilactobacillus xinyiensis]